MPTLTRLAVADDMEIGALVRDWYLIRIQCPCGHLREPRGEFIRRIIGPQTTMRDLRRRLRCQKCGARGARIEVFQLPR
jgi:hypothetical protein